jgi:hypothetical protein
MASKDPNMSNQGTAVKRKHVTFAIHQNLKKLGGLKVQK